MKIKTLVCAMFLLFVFNVKGFSAPYIQIDSFSIAKVKQMLYDGTAPEQTMATYEKLLNYANQLLTIENPTVMAKSLIPPSGDKHDYLSISRYWWPNPETPDGLPWIRNDGKTNPDTQTGAVDRNKLSVMSDGVWNLSLAYYFTDDEKYALKATSMIKTWFLDDDTRMNPHLEFAQSVPGIPKGRRSGILDGRLIVLFVPDAINLLSRSPHWKADHDIKMTKWLGDYLIWLTESDLGKEGSLQSNNHGSWYKFQVAALALNLGNKPLAKKMVELAQQSLDQQLNDEGGQIHELERTRSFFYSCFNLDALTYIALIGDRIGMDMWHYESDEKKSLALAVNYLTPVIRGEEWLHPDINSVSLSNLATILVRMSNKSTSKEYANLLTKVISIIEEKEQVNVLKSEVMQELWLLNSISY